ncbi:MAG: ABC transporter permease [Armatimonadota bacterium]
MTIPSFIRPMWAFVYRDYHMNRRYFTWLVVFWVYAIINSATIALIGVAAKDDILTVKLVLGALMWSFLSTMFNEIASTIAYERWEGTLEYTFMAPVKRLVHLAGVNFSAIGYSILRTAIVLGGLLLIVPIKLTGGNLLGVLVVLLIGSLAFMGLGLMAAVLPLMSPEKGEQATNIFQSILLLISGVYYPVAVLPQWLQPLAAISPATYALSACRKLMGLENPGTTPGHLEGAPLSAVLPELGILLLMGVILIPLGLLVFGMAERWVKRTGKLKRTG